KIETQNAVDNAVLSVAAYRARVLNHLGRINREIGAFLYGGGPIIPFRWSPSFIIPVLGLEALDIVDKGSDTTRDLKEVFLKSMELGISNYSGHFTGIASSIGICPDMSPLAIIMCIKNSQKNVACLADMSHGGCSGMGYGTYNGEKYIKQVKLGVSLLGITQDIYRWGYPVMSSIVAQNVVSKNTKKAFAVPIPILSYGAFFLGLKRNKGVSYKKLKSVWATIPPSPLTGPGGHIHTWDPEDCGSNKKSWLYADTERFNKYNKITLGVTKEIKDTIYGISFFGNIEWPRLYSFASAAAYNPSGSMFPIGKSDKIKPVFKNYHKAKNPGWKAHLVPDFNMLVFYLFGRDAGSDPPSPNEENLNINEIKLEGTDIYESIKDILVNKLSSKMQTIMRKYEGKIKDNLPYLEQIQRYIS
ncbi:hypothetical protein ACFL4O_03820, partial [bacterium]